MKKILKYSLYFLLSWFVIHCTVMIVGGLWDDVKPVDVIVVLGNRVEENGRPSVRLQSRLDKAVDLYYRGISNRIIVSGGLGNEGFEEAEVMKDYLVEKMVPEKNIIVDKDGYTTQKTAENVKVIMEREGMDSVLVVSQYYHILRIRLLFAKEGIENVHSSHAEMFPELRDFYSVPREFFGFYYYLFV